MQKEDVRATAVPTGMRLATAQLIEKLKDGKAGDVLTDVELSSLCGKTTGVGCDGYANLMSAIRHVLNNYGKTWQRVSGSGCIKCADDPEKVSRIRSKLSHITRTARRELKVAKTINISALPPEEQMKALAVSSQLGVLEQFGSSRATKALETRGTMKAPNMAKLLEMFK